MIREGHGIVRLRGGHTFEGDFEIEGPWVSLTGRERKPQAGGEVYYGPAGTWTWPERRVAVISAEAATASSAEAQP
jgi:hypothetical protein